MGSFTSADVIHQALCIPCNRSGLGRNKIALGRGRFHFGNLKRHQECESHGRAVLVAQERAQLDADQCYSTIGRSAPQTEIATKTVQDSPASLIPRDVMLLRVMVETRGSFRDFESWASAALSSMNRDQCKKGLVAMATLERTLTYEFLTRASACRLQADGQGRTYQVELGMVLWQFPPLGSWLLQPKMDRPWLLQLGDRGPWLIDRLICAREMPAELDTAGKVDMIAQSFLRACTSIDGEVNTHLHKHASSRVLAWASGGADMTVGHSSTTNFENMTFRDWEESHSAAKLLEHAVQNHAEARIVDGLLVSGAVSVPNWPHTKKPPSLAKILTTSEVFKKRCTVPIIPVMIFTTALHKVIVADHPGRLFPPSDALPAIVDNTMIGRLNRWSIVL